MPLTSQFPNMGYAPKSSIRETSRDNKNQQNKPDNRHNPPKRININPRQPVSPFLKPTRSIRHDTTHLQGCEDMEGSHQLGNPIRT